MPITESQINFILAQLEPISGVEHRRMFGGVGFFKQGKMFGMLKSDGTFLLKVDDSNRQDFIARGMSAFSSNKKGGSMPYYEVPADVIENADYLVSWAQKSIEIAQKS